MVEQSLPKQETGVRFPSPAPSSLFDPSPDHPPSDYQIWKRMARRMILDLPRDGATIVVITEEVGKLLKKGIAEIRGADLAKRCKMVSINRDPQLDKIMGLRRVIVDLSFYQYARSDLVRRVDEIVDSINVMRT